MADHDQHHNVIEKVQSPEASLSHHGENPAQLLLTLSLTVLTLNFKLLIGFRPN